MSTFAVVARATTCIGFVAFLAWMAVRSQTLEGIPELTKKSNFYLPIWYIICFVGGLIPTMMIQAIYGKWTAPPFNYPQVGLKQKIVVLHVVPACLWCFGSIWQVFLTTIGDIFYHKFFGIGFMIPIFTVFIGTAIISLVWDISPLGAHVKFMEWALALGTSFFFVVAMYFVARGGEWIDGHKICMNIVMIYAFGPGFFRVLRHLREFIRCRLTKAPLFTNYSDIPGTDYVKNFRDVESTYFCLAFLFTDAFAAIVMWQDGLLSSSSGWQTFCIGCLLMPVFAVILSVLIRFFPSVTERLGSSEDFNFSFALDYNWPVLMMEPVAQEADNEKTIELTKDS